MTYATLTLIVLVGMFLAFQLPLSLGGPAAKSSAKPLMQMIMSVAVLIVSLYIIVSHSYVPQDKHWAYGAVGTLLGFWLRGSR